MKFSLILFVAISIIFVSAYPTSENDEAPAQIIDKIEVNDESEVKEDKLEAMISGDLIPIDDQSKEPRLTCDLLSGLGVANSLCAAHCLLHFYKGGYCDSKGVCNCRK